MTEQIPSTGLKGIVHHWKDDLLAAISVALVALPLALGIAIASGAPPMSGLLAAIIGGVVTTFFRGSYVAINGPAAGLIVVVLTGVETLGEGNGTGFSYVLAATVIAGGIQMALGLLKLGKLGDIFPTSVVNGMLATIGITILIKQFHVALGNNSQTGPVLQSIGKIPESVVNLNPVITIIAVVCLAILIIHPRITNRFIKSIPAPLLVLVFAVPMVFLINLFVEPDAKFLGRQAFVTPEYLIHIPSNIRDVIIFPNFAKVADPQFWLVVISILLVASIETLISTKAVDKLDHYKRRTDLNKDLFGVGVSTAVAGFLGGLPIITVIVRSSVNVNHNAKTKWSNFYHGILLVLFVFFFPFIINEIPLACLAAILVYTGYKLASPNLFKLTAMKGWEQVLILIVTLVSSLALNLLWGIIIGVFFTLLIHWVLSELHIRTFLRHMVSTEINVVDEAGDTVHVEIKGIANFPIILKLINRFEHVGNEKHFIVNFARAKLVDSTVMDFIHDHREKYFTETDMEFIGLDVHRTSSPHPLALHVLEKPMQRPLTNRQNDIYHFGRDRGYRFMADLNWEVNHFKKFNFLEYHLLEYERNRLEGVFNENIPWVISDLTYNDGVLIAREEHHLTVMYIRFTSEDENFILTKENIRHIKSQTRKGLKDPLLVGHLDKLGEFLTGEPSYYIECVGGEILLYRKERLLSSKEVVAMHHFAERLCTLIPRDEVPEGEAQDPDSKYK